ncbi:MAG: aldose epimerase, partial [Lacticaseibacillus paracasei]|nr:aldose epimerase [Lacticaseibacillus paracasei]
MQLSAKIFAKVGSERITQYSLVNDHQMTLHFLTFGARVQQVRLPNAAGDDPNLLLGFV